MGASKWYIACGVARLGLGRVRVRRCAGHDLAVSHPRAKSIVEVGVQM